MVATEAIVHGDAIAAGSSRSEPMWSAPSNDNTSNGSSKPRMPLMNVCSWNSQKEEASCSCRIPHHIRGESQASLPRRVGPKVGGTLRADGGVAAVFSFIFRIQRLFASTLVQMGILMQCTVYVEASGWGSIITLDPSHHCIIVTSDFGVGENGKPRFLIPVGVHRLKVS